MQPTTVADKSTSDAPAPTTELETTLTREYAHLVNHRSFTPISRMSDWMIEGIAVYISQDTSYDHLVRRAVAEDRVIPIMNTSGNVQKEDLQHFTILPVQRDLVTGYGLSNSLVAFIVERYGGLDGFWKLVAAYDTSKSFPMPFSKPLASAMSSSIRNGRHG